LTAAVARSTSGGVAMFALLSTSGFVDGVIVPTMSPMAHQRRENTVTAETVAALHQFQPYFAQL